MPENEGTNPSRRRRRDEEENPPRIDHSIHSHPLPEEPSTQNSVENQGVQSWTKEEMVAFVENVLRLTAERMLEHPSFTGETGEDLVNGQQQGNIAPGEQQQPALEFRRPVSPRPSNAGYVTPEHSSEPIYDLANIDIARELFDRLGTLTEPEDAEDSATVPWNWEAPNDELAETFDAMSVDTHQAMGGRTASYDGLDDEDLKRHSSRQASPSGSRILDQEDIERMEEEGWMMEEQRQNLALLRHHRERRMRRATNEPIITPWAERHVTVDTTILNYYYCAECREILCSLEQGYSVKTYGAPDNIGYPAAPESEMIHRLGHRYQTSLPVTNLTIHFVEGGPVCYNCTWQNALGLGEA